MQKSIFTCFIILIASIHIFAQSWQDKIDTRLNSFNGTTNQFEFLVQFVHHVDISQSKLLTDKTAKGTLVMKQLHANVKKTQASIIDVLEIKKVPFQDFWIANVIWVYGDFELVKQIAQYPEVKIISENSRMKILEPIEQEEINENFNKNVEIPWGILQMNAHKVWEKGYTGQGVVVGGQDTGYEWEHESLKAKYRGWTEKNTNHNYNWHDAIRAFNPNHSVEENPCGLDVDYPCDDHNHGTHTMGTILGGTESLQIGVAPDATWIGCRNMERGWGTPQTYLECFQWFLAPTDLNNENPDPSKAPHVINNSWACPEDEGCNPNNFDILETAVNNLKAAGIVVVVSAGNSGADCETINTPAAVFENSFTVGAISENEVIANFSSRGLVSIDGSNRMKPNVVAPGVNVKSAIRGEDLYANFSGTSMAAPHVVGLVALLISADPTLAGDVERIETIIEQTALDRITTQLCDGADGKSIPNFVYGYGTIDALAAVDTLLAKTPISAKERFRVYPNPTNNMVTFQHIGYEGKLQIQIFAADGRQVVNQIADYSGGNKLRTIDLSNYANGVYYYRLCNESGESCFEGRILKK
ncbi:MAG: S8 family serine peptidase [Saprospiraceae bacterium]